MTDGFMLMYKDPPGPQVDTLRKLTRHGAAITPMLQAAFIITTPSNVHGVLHTLEVVQMQPVAPPALQAPMPPSVSAASYVQIVWPGSNV